MGIIRCVCQHTNYSYYPRAVNWICLCSIGFLSWFPFFIQHFPSGHCSFFDFNDCCRRCQRLQCWYRSAAGCNEEVLMVLRRCWYQRTTYWMLSSVPLCLMILFTRHLALSGSSLRDRLVAERSRRFLAGMILRFRLSRRSPLVPMWHDRWILWYECRLRQL